MSPFPFTHPAEVSPLAAISRSIRQICLLREQGRAEDALRVERTEFSNALRDLRLAHGPQVLPDEELRAMFAAEEKRVADAVVLSELLIPQLVKSFPAAPAAAVTLPAPARPVTAVPFAHDSTPSIPRAAAAGVSPVIADLLDAMLASERAGRRPVTAKT